MDHHLYMMVIDLSLFSDPKIIWVLRQDFSDPLRMQIGTIFADLSTQTVPLLCPRRTWPWKTKLRFADAIASEDPGPLTSGAEKNWPGVGKIITWAVTLDEKPEVSRSVDFDAEIVEQLVSVFCDGDAEFDDVVATENVPQRFRKWFELIQEEQKQSFQFKLL